MSEVGSTTPIHSRKSCVIYDAASGRIHHLHNVVTFVGGREPSEDQIAADALRVVASLSKPPAGDLHVLHIADGDMERDKKYRVDVQKRVLVAQK